MHAGRDFTAATNNPAWLRELYVRYGKAAVRAQLSALEQHGEAIDEPQLWMETALTHGFKFMPIERVEECLCGSRRITRLCRFVYWNLLGLQQCGSCGLLLVSPRLTQSAMRKVFREFYLDPSHPDYWGSRRVPIFSDIVRLLRHYGCQTVFDVGAAYGHFLSWAQQHGIRGAACEINSRAVEWGRSNLHLNLYQGTVAEVNVPPDSFDAVTSLDTLYYSSDPLAELQAMRRVLKPGGYIILRLRNALGVSFRAKRQGKRAVGKPVIPMPHLWAFIPETASIVLQRAGLQLVRCEPAAYSKSPVNVIEAPWRHICRFLSGKMIKGPILTRSFNIVGRRRV